jgi:hypothetical protein
MYNPEMQHMKYTDSTCGRLLQECETAAGRELSEREKVDLLLDTIDGIANPDEARAILRSITIVAVDRPAAIPTSRTGNQQDGPTQKENT